MAASVCASSARSKCTLSYAACELLMKTHVQSLDDKSYKDEDFEVLAAKYQSFLCACAHHTRRLNGALVSRCAESLFKVEKRDATLFGNAMQDALGYCLKKGQGKPQGKKHRAL